MVGQSECSVPQQFSRFSDAREANIVSIERRLPLLSSRWQLASSAKIKVELGPLRFFAVDGFDDIDGL